MIKSARKRWATRGRLPSESKSNDANKAFNSAVRILYRRDHSRQELQEKLSRRYDDDAVAAALVRVEEYGYLLAPEVLARRLTESLHRKRKGALRIRQELKKRGLPAVAPDTETELEKGRALIDKLFPVTENLGLKEKQKAYRHLVNRGFEFDTIQKVLQEVFK